MKDYKVKTIKTFTDGVENIVRNINDEFKCTKERYDFLKSKNVVELIEIETDEIIIDEEETFTKEEIENLKDDEIIEIKADNIKVNKKSNKKKSK